VETHITLDALTKAHPAMSYAQNWAAFMKQPADVRYTVLILLAGAVAFLYFVLIRPLIRH
jgi:hypothetical protein